MTSQVEKGKRILADLHGNASLVPEEYREWWQTYLKSHTNHYLNILSLLEDVPSGAGILEVGSSPAHCTVLLKQLGYHVTGLDIDPVFISDLCRNYGIDILHMDVEQEPILRDENSFDAVLFTEVFEHLRIDPVHALREIHRVLKPGGTLVFSIPNITPVHRIRFLFGRDYQDSPVRLYEKLQRCGRCGHFRMYSRSEASGILEYTGFYIQKIVRKGKLPKRIWKTVAMMSGPFQDRFRSHLYFLCKKPV
ncbi:MAG: class I SAM-dependent methyltransferase [bacterium]